MDKPRFFYFYDRTGKHPRPVVTVCRLRTEAGEYGYGWAVCSNDDQPCKQTGRQIAHGRAIAALQHKQYAYHPPGRPRVWLWRPAIYRPSALWVLQRCGVTPAGLSDRAPGFSLAHLLRVLPDAMQPYEEEKG